MAIDGNPDQRLIDDLRSRIDEELSRVLNGTRKVALLNFPNHGNPGDPAIWLGTRMALRRLGVRVVYQCSWNAFSPAVLRRRLGDGMVLLQGGGNFGDLYPGQQQLRERILAECRDMPLVQLPQSIHFRDRTALERMRYLIARHGNVTLMVRERGSEAIAREHFSADIRLAPDMAFGLGALPRTNLPEVDVLWLCRPPGDEEYVDYGGPPPGVSSRTVEWMHPLDHEPRWRWEQSFAFHANLTMARWIHRHPALLTALWRPYATTFGPLSRGWTCRGLHVLSSGRFVVTNKLHGHILATLAGIPHVAMDNSYGKVRNVYETWTRPSRVAHWADDGETARALAIDLLAGSTN